VFRAYQRAGEWLDCEYRDDRQADRRCYRRVVAQCHAESGAKYRDDRAIQCEGPEDER
jgi:hypothetical protein